MDAGSTLRVAVLGDAGVGKTAMIQAFAGHAAPGQHRPHQPTQAIDFTVCLQQTGQTTETYEIWEVPGSMQWSFPLACSAIREADAFVIVYSPASQYWSQSLDRWLETITAQSTMPVPEQLPIVIVESVGGGGHMQDAPKAIGWCTSKGSNFLCIRCNAGNRQDAAEAFAHVGRLYRSFAKTAGSTIQIPGSAVLEFDG